MNNKKLIDLINNFKNKKIIVVGDIMLDKHIHGTISRLSPEAPVPILKVESESHNPGGAGNLASNLSSLGTKVYLSGVVGNDDTKKILFKELRKRNIDTSCIIKTKKPTIKKIRGLAKQYQTYHQHMLRIDYEDPSNISKQEEQKLLTLIKNKIKEVDAIILCDYAKGTLTENLVKSLIRLARANKKLITADCKPINLEFYKWIDLLKPNKKEAIEMTLTNDIEEAGKRLATKLRSSVAITKGPEGMSVFENKEKIRVFNLLTEAKQVYDVSGAGDTILAVLTLSLCSGLNLKDSAELSNKSASIVISKPGVTQITKEELLNSLTQKIKKVPKKWGFEEIIVNNKKYCGKKMFIKKNHYSSYHTHLIKSETFYILEGELELIHKGEYKKIKSGETINIKPNEFHSFRAIEDTIFFEFSTQHLDEDNYRLTKSSSGSHEQWKEEIENATRNSKNR